MSRSEPDLQLLTSGYARHNYFPLTAVLERQVAKWCDKLEYLEVKDILPLRSQLWRRREFQNDLEAAGTVLPSFDFCEYKIYIYICIIYKIYLKVLLLITFIVRIEMYD